MYRKNREKKDSFPSNWQLVSGLEMNYEGSTNDNNARQERKGSNNGESVTRPVCVDIDTLSTIGGGCIDQSREDN